MLFSWKAGITFDQCLSVCLPACAILDVAGMLQWWLEWSGLLARMVWSGVVLRRGKDNLPRPERQEGWENPLVASSLISPKQYLPPWVVHRIAASVIGTAWTTVPT